MMKTGTKHQARHASTFGRFTTGLRSPAEVRHVISHCWYLSRPVSCRVLVVVRLLINLIR